MTNRTLRKIHFSAGALALVAAALLSACGKPSDGAPPAAVPAELAYVVVQPQRYTQTTELEGRTTPFQIAEVRPQIGGIVKQRQFVEGTDVKAGQALYTIDPATYRATYNSALASLARSEANLVPARLKVERYKELVAIRAVSQQDYDDATSSLKQNEADIASSKAAVDSARINLEFTRVTSPIAGRVGRSSVTPGALVTANQNNAMATVQQLDPMYVDVTQSSSEVLRLRRALASGDLKAASGRQAKVRLLLEDGTTYEQEGKLQFSEVTVDSATGAVTLRAVFPNPKQQLLPGMYVRAVIDEGVKPDALLIPQPAVSRDSTGKAVATVVDTDGKLVQKVLTTDRTVGDKWLVTAGLQPGDKLVVQGLHKVGPDGAFTLVPLVVNPSEQLPADPQMGTAATRPAAQKIAAKAS
jgi:membrane fusion protein, multidrug efflux system